MSNHRPPYYNEEWQKKSICLSHFNTTFSWSCMIFSQPVQFKVYNNYQFYINTCSTQWINYEHTCINVINIAQCLSFKFFILHDHWNIHGINHKKTSIKIKSKCPFRTPSIEIECKLPHKSSTANHRSNHLDLSDFVNIFCLYLLTSLSKSSTLSVFLFLGFVVFT